MTPTGPRGRFAPSPSGRMHLGNVWAALLSWLSVKSRGGQWILRIEDLDPARSKEDYARLIEDDLNWLGLDWDEGGLSATGPHAPYRQSGRSGLYADAFSLLEEKGLLYRCRCTRADIMATQAPHQADGRVVYSGQCRPSAQPPFRLSEERGAVRLWVPDREVTFTDALFGPQSFNLACQCGDFVVRRADGAWAYQLAVVVDDAEMGITEVARGCDLLFSAAQQLYLYGLLGLTAPEFLHLPLLCNASGQRLSKRDASLSLEELRKHRSPQEIIGFLANLAGLTPEAGPCRPSDLIPLYDTRLLPHSHTITIPQLL